MKEIYLDNSATTKISAPALKKYIEISEGCYGNPSSLHKMGFDSEKILSSARAEILRTLSASSHTLVFTASGSEANNLAIIGRALSKERYKRGAKIITTEGEHASVSEPISLLESMGFKVARIPTKQGKLDTDALISELTPDVILLSIMMVNNETGALYDIPTAAKLMRARCPDAYLHVDATQSYMKIPIKISAIGADMMTLSSHKIEGPKGVGALVIDNKIIRARGLSPLILGGGQEGGLRSGTENVPAIAAFAEAARLGSQTLIERYKKMRELREYIIEKLNTTPAISEISITSPAECAPHILNITLPGIKSETMLHYLSSFGIYVSSGSACSSNTQHSSSALIAFGRSEAEADCSIRISLSASNESSELDELISALEMGLKKLARVR